MDITSWLRNFQADDRSPHPRSAQQAVSLARLLQQRAAELQTPQERRQQTELDRMVHHPRDKVTLVRMTDQAFRSHQPHRAVDQLIHILDAQGIPRFFSHTDRALLKGFQTFGSYLPGVAVPLVEEKMHRETANVILPAEEEMLLEHLTARRETGVRMNVNYLGEALLGEEEAARRLSAYLRALQLSEIEVISVKISTIYSQINSLAREETIRTLADRMELLYRAAARERFTRADGTESPKFVYLDMEEYRDMGITAEVFMQTLDRPGLEETSAGIALQAYIPDSFRTQQRINEWAIRRVASGGAPVTIRIVKGANLPMERVEASVRGWPQAPFREKYETDAAYKRMVQEGMRPENLDAVRLGIASHNLFDLAYGMVLAAEQEELDKVQFEMLEGMANHQRRALFELTENLLLYAPACKNEDFVHAIGYLIRRLDENTGPDNFLRHAFNIEVGGDSWARLEQGFLRAFEAMPHVSDAPRRQQDRRTETADTPSAFQTWDELVNEPDTDFSLPQNVEWACELMDRWEGRCGEQALEIPLVVGGDEIFEDREIGECRDPSRPGEIVGRYQMATSNDIEQAVTSARGDEEGWRTRTAEERRETLAGVAREIRKSRSELMGAALAEAGKTLLESDPEVSEAVDFVEFYSLSAQNAVALKSLEAQGKGIVVVVSPWNFPIAIPCGGIAAALAAGNTVILKPASDSVLVAYELCQCFWRAGISRRTLQFVPCRGSEQGEQLVTHDEVDMVILTGATDTALRMLEAKPAMNLLAETGGKNATIVTALSDRDLAIKHVLQSAFSHGGQKCSATSLLILEEEVYEEPEFRRTLCDAVRSLPVGSAWDRASRIGPLIRPPSGALEKAIKELEPGEEWAVMPERRDDNPHLYSPGVKWGVQPESFTHCTELFGPVLGVMKARDLEEAIHQVNATGFGLTSGLESLDDREQEVWKSGIRAGNLYINRPTTGAIVLRQPFGGIGKSAFGPGIKAGGPNYVAQLMDFTETGLPRQSAAPTDPCLQELRDALSEIRGSENNWPTGQIEQLLAAIGSYAADFAEEFDGQIDHFLLIGQDNLRRYLPVPTVRVRVDRSDTPFEIFARICAAKTIGCRTTLSHPPGERLPAVELLDRLTESWGGSIEFVSESDERLAEVLRSGQSDRVRYAAASRVPQIVRGAVAANGIYIADAPVLMRGRLELLWYVQEQSLSIDYHRYGNLVDRAGEERAETL